MTNFTYITMQVFATGKNGATTVDCLKIHWNVEQHQAGVSFTTTAKEMIFSQRVTHSTVEWTDQLDVSSYAPFWAKAANFKRPLSFVH